MEDRKQSKGIEEATPHCHASRRAKVTLCIKLVRNVMVLGAEFFLNYFPTADKKVGLHSCDEGVSTAQE